MSMVRIPVPQKQMENLIVVDSQDRPQGEASRQVCHRFPGKLHRAILVILRNKKDQILLAQRAKGKLWGGVCDGTVATHVYPSETSEDSSRRALRKELNLENLRLEYRGKFLYRARWGKEGIEHEVCHLYLGESDESVTVNQNEITDLEWIDQKELMMRVKKNKKVFTPWLLVALSKLKLL